MALLSLNSKPHHALHFFLGLGLLFLGCSAESVVQGLSEKEANLIVEILHDNGIDATKQMRDTGRDVFFSILVPPKKRIEAIKVLNKHELPRRRARGYAEVFQESGLIPTAGEEKAKQLSALEGEIERQLKLIDGVLDVQVQIVMPEDSPLRTTRDQQVPTTASVTVKYMPGEGDARPLSVPEVQALVSHGVERLTPENVVVVMRPVGAMSQAAVAARSQPMDAKERKKFMMLIVGVLSLAAVAGFFAIFSVFRLRSVRGRLIRLQNEIAKARRKPQDGAPVA